MRDGKADRLNRKTYVTVPRDLAHRGQHAFVEGRLAQLLARKFNLDFDENAVPSQPRQFAATIAVRVGD